MATVALDCAVAGNEARSGEYLAGQFLAGYDPVRFTADFTNIQFVPVTGGIAGQAAVAPSLSVVRAVGASVTGASAVVAAQSPARSIGVTVVGASAVVAQQAPFRGLAATVAGASAVSADIIRVPVTVSFGCTIARAASVAPSMSVTNASFVGFDSDVHGQAAVAAQTVKTVSFGCTVARAAAVVADQQITNAVFVGFSAAISGQATVSVEAGKIVPFSCTIGTSGGSGPEERMLSVPPTTGTAGTFFTVGAKFTPTQDGLITHLRYWNPGDGTPSTEYILSLWTSAGVKLTTATAIGNVGGWQEVVLATPVPVVAGQGYVVSKYIPGTGFNYDALQPTSLAPHLTFVNSTYAMGTGEAFPGIENPGYHYFLDVVYKQTTAGTPNAVITPSLTVGHTVSFSAGVTGQANVTAATTKIVPMEARIQTIIPICGENLCNVLAIGGPFIVGGFSGPHAVVTANFVRFLSWMEIPVAGQASVTVDLGPARGFSPVVKGQARIVADIVRKLSLVAPIHGQAAIKAKINLDWLGPTTPIDILLPPTTEEEWILVPTDEEDLLLVPTTERTM